ncbi:MAG: right-handed parallel beta-helix repeat-containing protein [Planctomycetota bacterium]|nr:right-handed parallel beta-helix repeat-containing protein [Planctomycetota bacterium]
MALSEPIYPPPQKIPKDLPMKSSSIIALIASCVFPCLSSAGENTWQEIAGVVYGAKPDGQGPIGGGAGYKNMVTKGDFTVKDLDDLFLAAKKAKKGQVIFIPGETELDLTALIYIENRVLNLPEGVMLAGDRGQNGSKGALLASDALKMSAIISVMGPNVRVTGLRILGPNTKRRLHHHRRAFGPKGEKHKYYYKFPLQDGISTTHDGLEVDNCEISGFGHAGIFLQNGRGHHVHHNFIHHCQHNGLGYGISHDTASSLIEFNQFDWNRHSIAGTGRPGCIYTARNNVELGTSLSHCFDMHGGRDREDKTNIAGTSIDIHNNTFRAPQTPVVIRGAPEKKCDVHRNWFVKHDRAEKAVRAEKKTNVFDNAYGAKPKTAE